MVQTNLIPSYKLGIVKAVKVFGDAKYPRFSFTNTEGLLRLINGNEEDTFPVSFRPIVTCFSDKDTLNENSVYFWKTNNKSYYVTLTNINVDAFTVTVTYNDGYEILTEDNVKMSLIEEVVVSDDLISESYIERMCGHDAQKTIFNTVMAQVEDGKPVLKKNHDYTILANPYPLVEKYLNNEIKIIGSSTLMEKSVNKFKEMLAKKPKDERKSSYKPNYKPEIRENITGVVQLEDLDYAQMCLDFFEEKGIKVTFDIKELVTFMKANKNEMILN